MSKIVRTKTRASGGITAEEKVRLEAHTKLWIQRALRTEPIEPDKIVPAIEGIYAVTKLKKPEVIIVSSPMVMAFAYGAACAMKDKISPQTVAGMIEDAVRHSEEPEKAAALACHGLAGAAGIEAARTWSNAYQGGNYWAAHECYLTAFRDVIGLELPEYEAYAPWEQAAIHGSFRVMHEDFCMVSDFPEIIRMDNENRPHSEMGPSHRWRDGWSLYHWHGVRIPAAWIEDRASLTAEIAMTWQNVEQRRCACEILGWARILEKLKAKTIEKDADPMIGELVEVTLEGRRERFLRVLCGTGREFALPVPPEMRTALQANAWTFGMDDPAKFVPPEVRT